ncbi:hypothetical protein JCM8115_003601 [Rhodotorula mucilaginosa]
MAPPSNRKNKKRVADSDDEGSSSDDGERADRPPATERLLAKVDPEYLNTPIDLRQGDAKIRALYGNLKSLQKDVRNAETLLSDVAAEMADMLGQENRDEEYNEDAVFDRLKANSVMKDIEDDYLKTIDRQAELDVQMATLQDLRQRLTQGHQVTDIWKAYEQKVAEPMEKQKSKTARQKYQTNEGYLGYRDLIWENLTGGKPVPSVKRFLPREAGDDESDEEEIEFGAQTSNFQCPLELGVLVDPFKSTVCPHAFSGRAIKELIQQGEGRVHCPVAGCSQTLTLSTIQRDEHLARRVAAHVKRQKEGRTQTGGTQARTYTRMNLSESEEEEEEDGDEEGAAARKVKKEVKKEKAK